MINYLQMNKDYELLTQWNLIHPKLEESENLFKVCKKLP